MKAFCRQAVELNTNVSENIKWKYKGNLFIVVYHFLETMTVFRGEKF